MSFDQKTWIALGYYVYRLLDPRSGHTFYVGKGYKDRVFSHIRGAIVETADEPIPPKLKVISEIRKAGLEPIAVIHRHGLDEVTAFEVEAALIDAFPDLTNLQSGRSSDDFGCRSVFEIKQLYEAVIADLTGLKAVLINVRKSLLNGLSAYDAARYHWVIDVNKANLLGLVIAHDGGRIVDVFSNCEWRTDSDNIFTDLHEAGRQITGTRFGFVGKTATDPDLAKLVGQRLDPSKYQKRGSANPIRYTS